MRQRNPALPHRRLVRNVGPALEDILSSLMTRALRLGLPVPSVQARSSLLRAGVTRLSELSDHELEQVLESASRFEAPRTGEALPVSAHLSREDFLLVNAVEQRCAGADPDRNTPSTIWAAVAVGLGGLEDDDFKARMLAGHRLRGPARSGGPVALVRYIHPEERELLDAFKHRHGDRKKALQAAFAALLRLDDAGLLDLARKLPDLPANVAVRLGGLHPTDDEAKFLEGIQQRLRRDFFPTNESTPWRLALRAVAR